MSFQIERSLSANRIGQAEVASVQGEAIPPENGVAIPEMHGSQFHGVCKASLQTYTNVGGHVHILYLQSHRRGRGQLRTFNRMELARGEEVLGPEPPKGLAASIIWLSQDLFSLASTWLTAKLPRSWERSDVPSKCKVPLSIEVK